MPAPATFEYSVAALVEAHTALRNRIDSGPGTGVAGSGRLRLYTEADVLLVELVLSDPSGTVNGSTGQLAITSVGFQPAVATGTCTYGTIITSGEVVVLTAPAEAGGTAVAGRIVLSTVNIVESANIELISFLIG